MRVPLAMPLQQSRHTLTSAKALLTGQLGSPYLLSAELNRAVNHINEHLSFGGVVTPAIRILTGLLSIVSQRLFNKRELKMKIHKGGLVHLDVSVCLSLVEISNL